MTRTTLKKNIHKAVDEIDDTVLLEAVYTILSRTATFGDVLYYDLRVEGLGMRFYSVFQDTIKLISHSPFLFFKTQKNYRQVKIKDFPYYIVYEIENKKIIVSRLFHVKRDPKNKFKD
jgi:hypothetical protein